MNFQIRSVIKIFTLYKNNVTEKRLMKTLNAETDENRPPKRDEVQIAYK